MSQELPKQYDHAAAQECWNAHWEERGYSQSDPDPDRVPFTIVIPPPNVTGALHLGHALNETLQDSLIRFHRMRGENALWVPGTDHAGIATQAVVERRLHEEENLTRHDLGREALVSRIWDWKEEYEKRILNQIRQMGCSCDWRRTRFTLDETCTRAVRQTFFSLFSQGLIYRGKRLVNWDTFLQTAVSDDEVFYDQVKGHFWHFKYPVIGPKASEPDHVVVATTRPETMLGDTAVAVHPDPKKALDKVAKGLKERLAAANEKEKPGLQKQLEALEKRYDTHLPTLKTLAKMAADGREIELPLLKRKIRLVTDEWAKPELGSGCVKITPAHDPNDYQVGLRQDLPMINILNPDGKLNAYAGPYEGLTIKQARKKVVADLEEQGLLLDVEAREIELAHSDRSKTPIEPYLADQWFVKMDQLAQSAMDAVSEGQVEIIPARYAKSYHDWLSEKRDWPIGRQLWWGHQIPVWSRNAAEEGEADDLMNLLREDKAVQDGRVSIWLEINEERQSLENRDDPQSQAAMEDLPYGTVHLCICSESEDAELGKKYEAEGFIREEDVLDTWFSSALWPHSTLGWPEQTKDLEYYYPTSVLITSRDILTLWVARMVLTGLHNVGEIPFHQVFIHPKILDGDGETMSKSKGNGVDPLEVIRQSGTDALRFALAYLTTETQDVRIPVEYQCPHCEGAIPQSKKNRSLARIECKHCKKEFSTQWARSEEDLGLPRATVTSPRFEVSRNFCNKLWNAARFCLMNLENYAPAEVPEDALEVEDRWLLSRLTAVTQQVTEAFENFKYAEAARTLYDYAWDEFCSFYLEMVKQRLQSKDEQAVALRILAFVLDQLVRLLHPLTPFVTEEIWHRLNEVAPKRGLSNPSEPAESVMIADWPVADEKWLNPGIEAEFACFQEMLKGLREIRSRQNIPPKETIPFFVRCDEKAVKLIEPMKAYFASMAGAELAAMGSDIKPPAASSSFQFTAQSAGGESVSYEVFVDLQAFLDFDKEIAKQEKEISKLEKMIEGKAKKLENENFVSRAPKEVVERERESLQELREQVRIAESTLGDLKAAQQKA
ncbi:Valine--tRNA ligase [Planctomycetales bacterium 10988]|nr:Valine--tRNA ligase [Planctomycetales bacterium 10988]